MRLPIAATMRVPALALALALLPAAATAKPATGNDGTVSLAQLLAAGFEIKAAVMAGILVQNGPLAYICTAQDRVRPVAWTCLPLHR